MRSRTHWQQVYEIASEMVEDQGFIDLLRDMVNDANPMVVSNAVAALAEISETSETAQRVFQINTSTLQKMLAALNECTEWGQVTLSLSLSLTLTLTLTLTSAPSGARS